jgi:hypothetical protein
VRRSTTMKVFKCLGYIWLCVVLVAIAVGILDTWYFGDVNATFLGCRVVYLEIGGNAGPLKYVKESILNLPFAIALIPFLGLAFVVTVVAQILRMIIWLARRRRSSAP